MDEGNTETGSPQCAYCGAKNGLKWVYYYGHQVQICPICYALYYRPSFDHTNRRVIGGICMGFALVVGIAGAVESSLGGIGAGILLALVALYVRPTWPDRPAPRPPSMGGRMP